MPEPSAIPIQLYGHKYYGVGNISFAKGPFLFEITWNDDNARSCQGNDQCRCFGSVLTFENDG